MNSLPRFGHPIADGFPPLQIVSRALVGGGILGGLIGLIENELAWVLGRLKHIEPPIPRLIDGLPSVFQRRLDELVNILGLDVDMNQGHLHRELPLTYTMMSPRL